MWYQRNLFVAAGALVALLAGCRFNNSQLTTCQAEKEQLLTAIRTQRDSNQSLKTQVASLESRLDQAEKELARGTTGTRLSSTPSRPSVPTGANETTGPSPAPKSLLSPLSSPPAKTDGLPWRSPTSKPEPSKLPADRRSDNASPAQSRTSLVALARRDRRVQFDPEIGAARVDLPIKFEDQSATLTGEDKRQLDELARLLKGGEARDLRVMISGYAAGKPPANSSNNSERFASARQFGAARAQAVADYLDRHGIAQERLAVSGAGSRGESQNPVEVYLLDADASTIAWWPAEAAIRR